MSDPRLQEVKFLDYELRDKAARLEEMIFQMRDMYRERVTHKEWERKRKLFVDAYHLAFDLAEHFDILKYNKDIQRKPSAKENTTKGF